jgi:hypothetical protein
LGKAACFFLAVSVIVVFAMKSEVDRRRQKSTFVDAPGVVFGLLKFSVALTQRDEGNDF